MTPWIIIINRSAPYRTIQGHKFSFLNIIIISPLSSRHWYGKSSRGGASDFQECESSHFISRGSPPPHPPWPAAERALGLSPSALPSKRDFAAASARCPLERGNSVRTESFWPPCYLTGSNAHNAHLRTGMELKPANSGVRQIFVWIFGYPDLEVA